MRYSARISHRLAIAVAIPGIILMALAGFNIFERNSARVEMAKLGVLAEGVAKLSRLVHELQKERGASAVFIGSKGSQMREELVQQRKSTDMERAQAMAILSVLSESATGEYKAAIDNAQKGIVSLNRRREEISAFGIPAAASSAYFTDTIARFLSVASEIGKSSGQGNISMAVSAYVNFIQGKERAGQERAFGAGGVSAGKFDLAIYSKVLGLVAAQEVFFGSFLAIATPGQREFFSQKMAGSVIETVAKMRELIAHGGLSGEMKGLDGRSWFVATTERIDVLKSIEDRLAADLAVLTSAKSSEAVSALLVLSAFLFVALLGSTFVVWRVARSITNPIRSLNTTMTALAAGQASIEVRESARSDEIGEMAKAVLVFRDAAVDKIRMEKAAEEDRIRAEQDRVRTQGEAIAQERALVCESIGAGLSKLAAKDLTFRLTDQMPAAYKTLQDDFNHAIEQLEEAMKSVLASTSAIDSGTGEIATASDDLSKRTEQQAASLEETAAALDQITATGRKAAEGANHARDVVATAKADAEKTGSVVRQTVEAMSEIEKSSQQITQIIGVIDEIAFQTNLLALNAGVEAARAGDAGRGFAVVASEVRALAQRSADAAKEIKGLISKSSTQVANGVQLVAEAGNSLDRIMTQVLEINKVVADISAGAQEQATGLGQVNTAINQMDQVTQQNAAMVEESTAASRALTEETDQLNQLVGQFRVSGAAAGAVHKVVPLRKPISSQGIARPAMKVVAGRRGTAGVTKTGTEAAWQDF